MPEQEDRMIAIKFPKHIILGGEEISREEFIESMEMIFKDKHNRKPTLQELAKDINDFMDDYAEFGPMPKT